MDRAAGTMPFASFGIRGRPREERRQSVTHLCAGIAEAPKLKVAVAPTICPIPVPMRVQIVHCTWDAKSTTGRKRPHAIRFALVVRTSVPLSPRLRNCGTVVMPAVSSCVIHLDPPRLWVVI